MPAEADLDPNGHLRSSSADAIAHLWTLPLSARESNLLVRNERYADVAEVRRVGFGGRGLFARREVGEGTRVARFEGPVVDDYSDVPLEYRAHALNFADGTCRSDVMM